MFSLPSPRSASANVVGNVSMAQNLRTSVVVEISDTPVRLQCLCSHNHMIATAEEGAYRKEKEHSSWPGG